MPLSVVLKWERCNREGGYSFLSHQNESDTGREYPPSPCIVPHAPVSWLKKEKNLGHTLYAPPSHSPHLSLYLASLSSLVLVTLWLWWHGHGCHRVWVRWLEM